MGGHIIHTKVGQGQRARDLGPCHVVVSPDHFRKIATGHEHELATASSAMSDFLVHTRGRAQERRGVD